MNLLQGIDSATPRWWSRSTARDAIDPARILRAASTAHPVYTHAAVAAQARRHEIQGVIAPGSPAPTGAGASTRTACAVAWKWRRAGRALVE
jgi:predicted NAD/FAD-binding protein